MSNLILPDWISERLAQGREFRRMVQPMQLRSDADEAPDAGNCVVEGYATTFNQFYTLWADDGLTVEEQVDARAFDECDMSDVIMQYDHHGRVFARNKNGTLSVTPDEHGLKTVATLGGTELGRQVYEEIKGGYSDKMSFAFTVKADKLEDVEDHETGRVTVRRTILKIAKLYDVSVVSIPANDATEIFARGMADGAISWAAQELRAIEARRKAYLWLQLQLRLKGANS